MVLQIAALSKELAATKMEAEVFQTQAEKIDSDLCLMVGGVEVFNIFLSNFILLVCSSLPWEILPAHVLRATGAPGRFSHRFLS